jgi:hypothetical protein
MEARLATLFPDWWTFSSWKTFGGWYAVTDPSRENGFKERYNPGIYVQHFCVGRPGFSSGYTKRFR